MSTTRDIENKMLLAVGEPINSGIRPEMGAAAFTGVFGEFVGLTASETEADKAALLGHYMAYFCSYIGRRVYSMADGAIHYPNLFFGLVGESSKGRKGTAHKRVKQLWQHAVPDFVDFNIMNGLHSGEGLIHNVRDADPNDDGDKGVEDKRRLFVEEELSGPLSRMDQPGNTLSEILRQAFDGEKLQTITKNDPMVSRGAHISIVGHGVIDEITTAVTQGSIRNGLANRFIWLYSDRANIIPRPKPFPHLDKLVMSLQTAVARIDEKYPEPTHIDFNNKAGLIWDQAYSNLSRAEPGVLGRLTSRAEAHTLRLALLYAAVEGAEYIKENHLFAALDIFEYSKISVKLIWGNKTGNQVSEKLHQALVNNPEGLSRRQIYEVFQNHISSQQLQQAIDDLVSADRAEVIKVDTKGRTKELIVAN